MAWYDDDMGGFIWVDDGFPITQSIPNGICTLNHIQRRLVQNRLNTVMLMSNPSRIIRKKR